MKHAIALLLMSVATVGRPESAKFDLSEPISLNLKDANLIEVVTLLGAIANLPVQIDPGITGTVTVLVTDVPFVRVLEVVGSKGAVHLRVEGGKLVASPARRSASATLSAPDGPNLDHSRLSGPRIPVEEYSNAFRSSSPLLVRVSMNGASSCALVSFERFGSWRVEVPGQDGLVVSQFGWEPVSRTRFLALEGPGFARAIALSDANANIGTGEVRNQRGSFAFSIVPVTKLDASGRTEPCGEPIPLRSAGRNLRIRLEVRERREEGLTVIGGSPTIGALQGTAFSSRSGVADEFGQHREYVLYGFLSNDGKSIAVTMTASATWRDPADGREYVYSQVPASQNLFFEPVGNELQRVSELPRGAALMRGLELAVSLAGGKSDADE
jgi:hypothetical protein